MSAPAIYFTTTPCYCPDPRIGRKLHRVDCPARCRVVCLEDAGARMLGAGRGQAYYVVHCGHEDGHAGEHVGIGADGNPVVWR